MISSILYKPSCCPRGKKDENATELFAKTRFSYELTPHNFSYGPMVLELATVAKTGLITVMAFWYFSVESLILIDSGTLSALLAW